ncbi:hypothetical protein IscW_ISCW015624 [Ixodes scapularis]|uniref:Uncharacterized protein n=1 Tax=Ixodes scapularis TaxID=6945 RepID=B7P4F2_IXOSC|nr:hypothetical protein IscW_ISCW015624 [Ixodes scapularis]|eukprot:XP_002406006.1 hypothetical protein IscW_ISCW015624 [Ixodes scapularis]
MARCPALFADTLEARTLVTGGTLHGSFFVFLFLRRHGRRSTAALCSRGNQYRRRHNQNAKVPALAYSNLLNVHTHKKKFYDLTVAHDNIGKNNTGAPDVFSFSVTIINILFEQTGEKESCAHGDAGFQTMYLS